jgi:hypothetical protein
MHNTKNLNKIRERILGDTGLCEVGFIKNQ